MKEMNFEFHLLEKLIEKNLEDLTTKTTTSRTVHFFCLY